MSLHTLEGSTAALDLSLSEVLAGLDVLGVSVIVTDLDGKLLAWSDSSTALFGWSAEQVLGSWATDVTRWGMSQGDAASVLLTADGPPWSGEYDVVRADGEQVRVHISAALAGADKNLVLSLARSVETPPAQQASYDRLTGLPNRGYLAQRLEQWQQDGWGVGLAVLLVDIDRFKLVNDNRGHGAGDALLIAVANRLQASCRPSDTLARVGDDEFVLVRTDVNAEQARRFAEAVRSTFDEPCEAGDTQIPVSISIGIASTDDVSAAHLLTSAERALSWAKAGGSGRIEVHSPAIRGATEGRLQLLTDLRQAINDGTLALHYQPIVHAQGRVAGVEALLRWSHPRHGTVSPADVISLAEDHGLMPALGAWILNRACSDIAGSPHAGAAALQVAVNLSTRELADPNIVQTVRGALRRSNLAAQRLILEVTETAVIADPETTSARLHALKQLGVRLALDDFGTGYSSLVYVRRFPVDMIKIDRSFIAGMATNSEDLAIVASLTNLAGAVGLDVVAEGVETLGQAEILRRLGCTYMQGFLWSPAVPLVQLAALLPPGAMHLRVQEPRGRKTPPSSGADHETNGHILALHRSGASVNSIAAALNADSRRTPSGSRWQAGSVERVITALDAGRDAEPLGDR
jgi:diguanylate cyclase (GGDEF)-like protein/PAS domain S-box-containing protein